MTWPSGVTPNQNLYLVDVPADRRVVVDDVLASHGIRPADRAVGLRRVSMACPALPTCGLAVTDAERALPGVLDDLQALLRRARARRPRTDGAHDRLPQRLRAAVRRRDRSRRGRRGPLPGLARRRPGRHAPGPAGGRSGAQGRPDDAAAAGAGTLSRRAPRRRGTGRLRDPRRDRARSPTAPAATGTRGPTRRCPRDRDRSRVLEPAAPAAHLGPRRLPTHPARRRGLRGARGAARRARDPGSFPAGALDLVRTGVDRHPRPAQRHGRAAARRHGGHRPPARADARR